MNRSRVVILAVAAVAAGAAACWCAAFWAAAPNTARRPCRRRRWPPPRCWSPRTNLDSGTSLTAGRGALADLAENARSIPA